MLLVYVAGPFSGRTRADVERNIRAAEEVGVEVAKLGAMPLVPHSNTSHPDYEDAQPYSFWIDGTLELLRRCDAVLMMEDYERSNGARGELNEARVVGKLVFFSLAQLADYLKRPDTIPAPSADDVPTQKSNPTPEAPRAFPDFPDYGTTEA